MSSRSTIIVQLTDAQLEYMKHFRDHDQCMQAMDGHWKLINNRIIIERSEAGLMIDFLRTLCALRGQYFGPVKKLCAKIEDKVKTAG